jgi:Helix-turn-helix domain
VEGLSARLERRAPTRPWNAPANNTARNGHLPSRGFQTTRRDVEIVSWLARAGAATAAQVGARWPSMPESNVYRRLRGLVRLGLVEHRRLLHGEPGVYLATRVGLDMAELAFDRAARISPGRVAHQVAATWLGLALEAEHGAENVLWERELRSADGNGGPPSYAVELGGRLPSGRPKLHFPDFVVFAGGDERPVAVELELTAKGRARLEGIVRGYVRARHLARACYYVGSPAVERSVMAAVRAVRAERVVEVVRWTAPVDASSSAT